MSKKGKRPVEERFALPHIKNKLKAPKMKPPKKSKTSTRTLLQQRKEDKELEGKSRVIQNPAITEIEVQLNAKQEQFKLLQNQARNLKAEISQKQSQLEQIQHSILKTAASYNTLSSLKKTLSLQEGYKQIAKEPLLTSPTPKKNPLSKKAIASIKKNLKSFNKN